MNLPEEPFISKYICKQCKDPFYTKKELDAHEKKNRKARKEKRKEDQCPERDVSPKILKWPICGCGARFTCPDSLTRHKKTCSYITADNTNNMKLSDRELKIKLHNTCVNAI